MSGSTSWNFRGDPHVRTVYRTVQLSPWSAGARSGLLQPSLEPGIERIVAREHVAEVGNDNVLGALVAQHGGQRLDVLGRAMQRQHARGSWAAQRSLDAETLLRLGEQ